MDSATPLKPRLDEAPPGQKFFIYPKLRGEHPICRLEMKFPKQQEVFYLRHVLLNFAKRDFLDCKRFQGVLFATHEEALLASGYFADKNEATRVLEELVALRYTAAQLRFAFIVLMDQDAAPVTLFKKFQTHLMKMLTGSAMQTCCTAAAA